jgi:hypothetical protein
MRPVLHFDVNIARFQLDDDFRRFQFISRALGAIFDTFW